MLFNLLPEKLFFILMVIGSVGICTALLALFKNKLPKDQGREFAFNGKLSAGKVRGAGIVFVCAFIIAALLFVPVSLEYVFYYVLVFLGMLSGYLDDRAEKPWGEYKKGAIDLVISALTAANFVYFNQNLASVSFFGMTLDIHPVLFGVIAAVLVWMLINAVNCCDGIDGFCGSLTTVSMVSVMAAGAASDMDSKINLLVILMILVLIPYLWKNAEPSTMMMGDAGSRALGLFLCICVLKTGNILLTIPLCLVICLDGLLGIAKVSLIRFLKINAFKNIRTPLHDHFRKNKGWSNTQVIFRFCMIQAIISAVTVIAITK
ncbi:MAG: phospho-N-acetylmuramoyl-pentapeptide-transferase [Ruminococcaceae bacterium]|nr:phospho-N-acetylmuramoyl-pentapeptide-transferase [Oscillospiraceae bacterium]